MRAVKFKKWIPLVYLEVVNSNRSTKVEGTGQFENDFASNGLFHKWGINYDDFETNAGNYTVALVELDDGTMEEVLPINLKFIDKPKKNDNLFHRQ